MFSFLMPSRKPIVLPHNFLRSVFQKGTGIYRADGCLPTQPGSLFLAMKGTTDLLPDASTSLRAIGLDNKFDAAYFRNAQGGTIIQCTFDDPSLLNLWKRSALTIIGNTKLHVLSPQKWEWESHILFAFLAHETTEGLIPKKIALLSKFIKDGISKLSQVDARNDVELARSLCIADILFKQVLEGRALNPEHATQQILGYTDEELIEHFTHLKQRSLGSLEREVQIVDNIPLNTYATGPVI
jgi:hypothetical protein